MPFIEYNALEIQRELIAEQQGIPAVDPEKRQKMKHFIKMTLGTDKIQNVAIEDLKQKVEGDGMLNRIQYRK